MEWVIVKHSISGKPIGALGFIGNKIAVVSTFYEDKDWDHDGTVSLLERFGSMFGLKGKAVTEVLTQAMSDPDIYIRDPSLRSMHGQAVVNFASGMITEGIYKSYLSFGVSQAAGAVAAELATGAAARFFIKKGMEAAVKQAYEAAAH